MKRSRDNDDLTSQPSQTSGAPLVDDETYTRIVDPACSECDDGGEVASCRLVFSCLPSLHFLCGRQQNALTCFNGLPNDGCAPQMSGRAHPGNQGKLCEKLCPTWESFEVAKCNSGTVFPCDGHCLRSFHLGLDEASGESGESVKYTWKATLCNPLCMPEDLARRLNVCS